MKHIVMLFTFCLFVESNAFSNEVLHYEINATKIIEIVVTNRSVGPLSVIIKLGDQYKSELENITKANIGKNIIIEHRGRQLISMPITTAVPSGVVVIGKLRSKQEAISLVKELFIGD